MKPKGVSGQAGEPRLQWALWGAVILVLVGVLAAGSWLLVAGRTTERGLLAEPEARLPDYGLVPDFSLIERSGRTVELAELLGKIWILDFIYTHCPDSCPLQSAEMARLQADLVNESEVRLITITLDPNRDTPEVLSRYANHFRADHERWLFLTGEKETIYRFAREGLHLGVIDPRNEARASGGNTMLPEHVNSQQAHLLGQRVTDRRAGAAVLLEALCWISRPGPAVAGDGVAAGRVLHSSRFVLVDRRARIRSYYDSSDAGSLARLRRDVKALLQEG